VARSRLTPATTITLDPRPGSSMTAPSFNRRTPPHPTEVRIPERSSTYTSPLGASGGRGSCLDLGGCVGSQFRNYFDLYLLEASPDLVTWAPLTGLLRTNASTNPLLCVDGASANLWLDRGQGRGG